MQTEFGIIIDWSCEEAFYLILVLVVDRLTREGEHVDLTNAGLFP